MKKLFFAIIGFCLLLNLFTDFNVYRQLEVQNSTGDWVNHSYEVLQKIGSVKVGILESRVRRSEVQSLKDDLKNLIQNTKDHPAQYARAMKLSQFSSAQILESRQDEALWIVSELQAVEEELLKHRLATDEESNAEGVKKVVMADLVDLLLIFAALGFYFYERKQSARMQAALTSALSQIEVVNQNLTLNLAKKDSIFKTTVHDLKNPLGSILGLAELLSEGTRDQSSVLKMANLIQEVSNNTLKLVGSALETETRVMDETEMKVESVPILGLVKETCSLLEPVAFKKQQTIAVSRESVDMNFLAQRQALQNVFFNLVGNALKFSPANSVVSVQCVQEQENYKIQIKDQGPGFAKEDFEKLFTKGLSLTAKPSGNEVSTGYGLFSVKQTLEAVGGDIEIVNNPDVGSCVTVRFKALAAA